MADTKRRKVISASINDDNATMDMRVWGIPDAAGTQTVDRTITVNPDTFHADMLYPLAAIGFQSVFANQYQRMDDPTPDAIQAAHDKLHAAVADGSWEPGRAYAAAEPTDLELAIAEATGQPVERIVSMIADTFHRVGPADATHPHGTGDFKLDKNGRKSKVFGKRYLAAIANDPKVKPILARLLAERAKRMGGKPEAGAVSVVGDLFGVAPTVAEAAQ